LHAVWDGSLLYHRTEKDFGGSEARYLAELLRKLKTEPWLSKIRQWTNCPGGLDNCLVSWANEIAKISCNDVYKGVNNGDVLGDAYYQQKIGIAEELIARGGIRLALILNKVWG
jgi:hypothetical protein